MALGLDGKPKIIYFTIVFFFYYFIFMSFFTNKVKQDSYTYYSMLKCNCCYYWNSKYEKI